jgi:hypothetical protein
LGNRIDREQASWYIDRNNKTKGFKMKKMTKEEAKKAALETFNEVSKTSTSLLFELIEDKNEFSVFNHDNEEDFYFPFEPEQPIPADQTPVYVWDENKPKGALRYSTGKERADGHLLVYSHGYKYGDETGYKYFEPVFPDAQPEIEKLKKALIYESESATKWVEKYNKLDAETCDIKNELEKYKKAFSLALEHVRKIAECEECRFEDDCFKTRDSCYRYLKNKWLRIGDK